MPEIGISKDEGQAVADALSELAKHYDLGISGPVAAWLNLATVVGGIAGSHYLVYRIRTASRHVPGPAAGALA